jgi:type IV pilus assembly protein PilA
MDVRVRWLLVEKPTSTAMIELLICLTIMGAMIFVAARGWQRARPRFDIVEAVGLMTGPRVAMTEYRAVTGTWPATNEQAAYQPGDASLQGRIGGVAIRDGGAVDFTLSGRTAVNVGKIVTIRAWKGPGEAGAPVAWLCGHARAANLVPDADDRTTLLDGQLPSPCRGAR